MPQIHLVPFDLHLPESKPYSVRFQIPKYAYLSLRFPSQRFLPSETFGNFIMSGLFVPGASLFVIHNDSSCIFHCVEPATREARECKLGA